MGNMSSVIAWLLLDVILTVDVKIVIYRLRFSLDVIAMTKVGLHKHACVFSHTN